MRLENRNRVQKNCKGCNELFVPPTFRQRYCDTCRGRCKVDGCSSAPKARGYCATHLWRVNIHGDPGQADLINKRQSGFCSVDGCHNPAKTRGLCHLHYYRVRVHGIPGGPKRVTKKTGVPCEVNGCTRKTIGNGLCRMHYERVRNTGQTGGATPERRQVGAGHVSKHGYIFITHNGRTRPQHRVILEQMLGRPLNRTETCHHKNGQRSDNRPANLELWSSAQPPGQRVIDKVAFGTEMITTYPEFVSDEDKAKLAAFLAKAEH